MANVGARLGLSGSRTFGIRSGEGVIYCDEVSGVANWKGSNRKLGFEPFVRSRRLGIGVNASAVKIAWDDGLDFCGARRGRNSIRMDVTSDSTKDGTDSNNVRPAYPSARTLSVVTAVSFKG